MFCAISGKIPLKPVFSPKTGYLYEKSLILKSININGTCPVSSMKIDPEKDLLEVKSPLKSTNSTKDTNFNHSQLPRPVSATSIPQMLKLLNDEWDTVMLELFEVQKQLQITKEDLVKTLYERDAACRVIARLLSEKEKYNQNLVNGKSNTIDKKIENSSLRDWKDIFKDTADSLGAKRKASKSDRDMIVSDIQLYQNLKVNKSLKNHMTTKPKVSDVIMSFDGKYLLTAGQDGQVFVIDMHTPDFDVVHTLSKGKTPILKINISIDGTILLTVNDNKITAWRGENASQLACHSELVFKEKILTCVIHPCQKYGVACYKSGGYSMFDLDGESLNVVHTCSAIIPETETTAVSLHVDGLLIACSTKNRSAIAIIEILNETVATELELPERLNKEETIVNSFSFSENGYHLAVGTTLGVCVYDLRKQAVISDNTLEKEDAEFECTTLKFDSSGKLLGVLFSRKTKHLKKKRKANKVSESLLVLFGFDSTKKFVKLKEIESRDVLTELCFSPDSRFIITGSKKRAVNIYDI